ncbi:MAG: hypothetical protein KDA61_09870, partial [Planctomycetales bacterium]|nr:hypothetical protein [Planctomycetales bacterium]
AKDVPSYAALNTAIAEARGPQEPVDFLQSFTKMFSASMPEGVDPQLLSETLQQWKSFWLTPAMMAAAIMVVFALAFHDRTKTTSTDNDA